MGDRFLSSAGAGGFRVLSMRVPNPSPEMDKNRAPMGPEILSSTGAGVWRKAPKAFPDSSSVLDKFQSAKKVPKARGEFVSEPPKRGRKTGAARKLSKSVENSFDTF